MNNTDFQLYREGWKKAVCNSFDDEKHSQLFRLFYSFPDVEEKDKNLKNSRVFSYSRIQSKSRKKSDSFDEDLKRKKFKSKIRKGGNSFEGFDFTDMFNNYEIVDVGNVEIPSYMLLKLTENLSNKWKNIGESSVMKNKSSKVRVKSRNRIKRKRFKNVKDESAPIFHSQSQKVCNLVLG